MKIKLSLLLLLIGLLLPGSYLVAAPVAPSPVVVVKKINPSNLNGMTISQYLWSQPPTIAKLYYTKLGNRSGQSNQIRLAYDDKNLYVAFRCFREDSKKAAMLTPEGEIVPLDDSVSVYLDLKNDRTTYLALTSTVKGERSGEKGRQFIHDSWNGNWTVQTGKEKDAWTAFMTIPFSSIGIQTPKPGTSYGATFNRYCPSTKWPSFWARARKDPREAQSFGEIVFAGADEPVVSLSDVEVQTPGKQPFILFAHNPTARPVALFVEAVSDGKKIDSIKTTTTPGDKAINLALNYPEDGWHDLTITVKDSKGKLLTRTPGIPVRIPDYASRLSHYANVLKQLQPAVQDAKSEKADALDLISFTMNLANKAKGDVKKWNALGERVDLIEQVTNHLRVVCADRENKGYAVGTETALRKVMRDRLFEGKFGEPAQLSVAKNEYESTQVVVFADKQELKDVSVSISPLTGPKGAVIPADSIKLNLVDFVKTKEPPYEIQYIGWYPDPLMDYKPFTVANGARRPIWITIHPNVSIPGGIYKAAITIKPSNAPETVIPLEVRVRDFALPTTMHLKTAFAFFEAQWNGWYGRPITEEERRDAYALLLAHHLNPTNIYSKKPSPDKADIPFCAERGMNAFTMMFIGGNRNEAARAEIASVIKNYQGYLKENGWSDRPYIYGFDELSRDKYPDLRDMFGWIKKQFPGLPTMSTVLPNPELKGYVDIWVPLVANFRYDESQQYIKNGDQVWWYVCCGPERPYPNFFVDYPATDPRIVFWMNWKYQVPGFLYWTINRWQQNLKSDNPKIQKALDEGKRWPEIPWNTQTSASFNGDGHLTYPGPDGKLLSSIRLESIRDGIEDYEYFYQLNSLVEQAEKNKNADPKLIAEAKNLLKVRSGVVKSTKEFTTDPRVILKARDEVADMIEKLNGELKS